LNKLILLSAMAASLGLSSASAGTLFAIDDYSNTLLQVNPTNGAISVVGSTGVSAGDFGDLTYDASNGQLYWVAGRGNNNLYTINPVTGAATLVGSHGIGDLFALAWDPNNNTLYAEASSGAFYSLDSTTGAATYIGSNSVYPGGLVFNSLTGMMYLLAAGNDSLYSIDVSTGAATYVQGGANSLNDNGAAYDPTTNSYWVDTWSSVLVHYSADFSSSTTYSYSEPMDGIAYAGGATAAPEPGTTMLLGGGLLAAGLLRFRKRSR
jgi:hypothetical protein